MQIQLSGSAYRDRSPIASAQETINLYAEKNSGNSAPADTTYYLTPGSVIFATPPDELKNRCTYRTTIGTAYTVIGTAVYSVQINGALVHIGNVLDRPSQIIMADNGQVVVLVDGTDGWAINMEDNLFGQITDPAFYGAAYALFLDTFFVFNRPHTNQFYISLSNVDFAMLTNSGIVDGTIVGGSFYTNGFYQNIALTGGSGAGAIANITVAGAAVTVVDIINPGMGYAIGDVLSCNPLDIGNPGAGGFTYTITDVTLGFDPLDIAAKSGSADNIAGLATVHKELWLIGELTTEIWIGTGAADFYFQLVQGAYIDHGCAAAYSIATQDLVVIWLMQDKQGQLMIMQGQAYDVGNIATSYLVNQFLSYETISDAIGFMFQQENRAFYVIAFPTANVTWVYDLGSKEWFKWSWLDDDGNVNRHRANCAMFFNGNNLVGDWENGKLYKLDPFTYTDFDGPILRRKTFTHEVDNYQRIVYNSFDAYIEVGTQATSDPDNIPQISLKWSDDAGQTYSNQIEQGFGQGGNYLTTVSWNRLGMARDRVFMLEWSAAIKTSLMGAFIEAKAART